MKRIATVLAIAVLAGSILSGCAIEPLDGWYGDRGHYGSRSYYGDRGYYGERGFNEERGYYPGHPGPYSH